MYFCRSLIFTLSVMEIQQCKVKSTFPARIAPFSVPLERMEAVQGLRIARFERETWTYFALLYLHNGRGKNQRSAEINSDRTPLRACYLTLTKYPPLMSSGKHMPCDM